MRRLHARWPRREPTLAVLLTLGLLTFAGIAWWSEGPSAPRGPSAGDARGPQDEPAPSRASLRGHEPEEGSGATERAGPTAQGGRPDASSPAALEAAVLSGRVVDEAGHVVSGLRIRVEQDWFGDVTTVVADTDEEGAFAVEMPRRSTCTIWLSGSGWADSVTESFPGSGTVELRVFHAAAIEGVAVERGTGRPVCGVRLWAVPPAVIGAHVVRLARTDEHGRFSLSSLVPGRYSIQTRSPSELPEEAETDWVPFVGGLTPTGTMDLRVELRRGRTIAGVVRETGRRPCPEQVAVSTLIRCDPDGVWAWPVRELVGPDGAFELRGLAPGAYTLRIRPVDCGRLGVVQLEGILAGRRDLIVELPLAVTLDIRLVSAAGADLGLDGYVLVYPSGSDLDDPLAMQAEAVEVGLYRASHLDPERTYDVEARGFSGHLATIRRGLRPDAEGVTVTLRVGGTITCVVLDEEGRPVHVEVPVVAVAQGLPDGAGRTGGEFVETRCDPDGTVALRGLEDHAFCISAGGGNCGYVSVGQVEGVRPGARNVELRVRRGARLAGRLVDEQGRPVSTLCLRVRSDAVHGGFGDFVAVGVDGRFEFEGVPPGELELEATIDDAPRFLGRFTAPTQDLVVVVPDAPRGR